MNEKGAIKKNLVDKIKELADRGVLPEALKKYRHIMATWQLGSS